LYQLSPNGKGPCARGICASSCVRGAVPVNVDCRCRATANAWVYIRGGGVGSLQTFCVARGGKTVKLMVVGTPFDAVGNSPQSGKNQSACLERKESRFEHRMRGEMRKSAIETPKKRRRGKIYRSPVPTIPHRETGRGRENLHCPRRKDEESLKSEYNRSGGEQKIRASGEEGHTRENGLSE